MWSCQFSEKSDLHGFIGGLKGTSTITIDSYTTMETEFLDSRKTQDGIL